MKHLLASAAALALGLASSAARADPGYYVVTVYDDPGVRTADFRYWSVKQGGEPASRWPEIGAGWNVNGRWYTEVLGSWLGSSEYATEISTIEWQNDVLLTRGQYPFDLAVHTLLSRPQNPTQGASFEYGPVFQTDIDRTQLNLNLIFERGFGALADRPTRLKYQWQTRYRWKPWLNVGAQGFGELGTWNDWSPSDRQSHRAGPALFGSVPVGGGTIAWQAAYLLGTIYAEHGEMFTMRVKYDF